MVKGMRPTWRLAHCRVVTRGQSVAKGDALISLEAMKMEHTLRANVAGVVSELNVEAQQQVVEGSTLLVLSEPTGTKE